MKISHLSETVSIKTVSENATVGVFEVEGLYSGYGLTIGNALRRALLSSLPGGAITQFKVKGVAHEFTTIPDVKEDVVEISLNLKQVRFRIHTDEPQVLLLKVKGDRVVTAGDFEKNSLVEVINTDQPIATITSKSGVLEMEITVEKGLGYSSVDSRKQEKLGVGVIAVDAFFTPVTKVNYVVENMRVGDRTDFNRLRLEIETDGSISPSAALHKSANVLKDHFEKVSAVVVQGGEEASEKKTKKSKTKAEAEENEE
ncbi:MAG: DNA-directed RNA polymerase subunit alpha [Anaplasmataceae bacterium]|nr:DNA-directed RNA polymerase subunit alpha [Anaplasmataceae bacterium]